MQEIFPVLFWFFNLYWKQDMLFGTLALILSLFKCIIFYIVYDDHEL